ncbi:hypothetical protein LOCUS_51190 [Klebsiella pneumoniae]|nr:hypothetical protein LOCUS_51190 [Klebsiella pneumoniae]
MFKEINHTVFKSYVFGFLLQAHILVLIGKTGRIIKRTLCTCAYGFNLVYYGLFCSRYGMFEF